MDRRPVKGGPYHRARGTQSTLSALQPLAGRPAQASQSPAPRAPPTTGGRGPLAAPSKAHAHRRQGRGAAAIAARPGVGLHLGACGRLPYGWIVRVVGALYSFGDFARVWRFCGVGLGIAGGATMATAPAHVAGPTYSLKSTLAFSSFDSSRVNSKGFSACTSLSIHRNGRVRAGLEGESSVSQHKESTSRPILRRKKPVPSPGNMTLGAEDSGSLETVLVEDERVSLEGVGRVDREASSSGFSWGRAGILVAGDLVALITFAFIGRYSHGLTSLNWDAVRTADPFIAGWLLGSYFLGGYGTDGQGMNGVSRAATSALKSWAVGVPLGLVIRGIVTSHVPAQAFILVSLGSLLVLMVGWRVTFVYVFASGGNTVEKRPGNRSGGIFEFIELLTSLVRRW